MRQDAKLDLPAAAYSKAVAALEDFHSLAAEYSILLDTQRALLAAGNFDAAVDTVARGDCVARQAAACGRRLAPWREALDSRQYTGTRASDLARRIATATAGAVVLAGGAASIEAVCIQKRDEAAREMAQMRSRAPLPGGAVARYGDPSATSVRALDRHG